MVVRDERLAPAQLLRREIDSYWQPVCRCRYEKFHTDYVLKQTFFRFTNLTSDKVVERDHKCLLLKLDAIGSILPVKVLS
jgi:hypothetical protein